MSVEQVDVIDIIAHPVDGGARIQRGADEQHRVH